MISHTMIVSFTDSIPEPELDRFLADMEQLLRDSGPVAAFTARRHIRVPGDEHSPVFVASVLARVDFADRDALEASFTAPGLAGFVHRWQSRHPYRIVWANHAPLA